MPATNVPQLALKSVIGFAGSVSDGLHAHPDGVHFLSPLGSTIVIRSMKDDSQDFLQGHTDRVTCVAVSKSGNLVATGQKTHMGFQADIIVWDFAERRALLKLSLHKVKVQTLAFSSDEKYLASVGGEDDGSLVVWDLETGKAVCGSPATSRGQVVNAVKFYNNSSSQVVTAGKSNCRVWDVDFVNRKLRPTDFNMGKNDRCITSLCVDSSDQFIYCGTLTGDVLQLQATGPKIFKHGGPTRKQGLFQKGIHSVALIDDETLLVGSGSGTVSTMRTSTLRRLHQTSVHGLITSLSVHPSRSEVWIGTDQSNIYALDVANANSDKWEAQVKLTCHFERINSVAFPNGFSALFATASLSDVRIWNADSTRELLRIVVPNLECNCVDFLANGKCIVTGWSDGKIRGFSPEFGKLLFTIHDAHQATRSTKLTGNLVGVTSIASTTDSSRILSGGSDGMVRVWKVTPDYQTMEASMKEHKASVTCITVRSDDAECVTSSDDGSCIVWNLKTFTRDNVMYAQTYFKQVKYLNDESQILTAASDKKVTYWDAFDCNEIRELECSSGEINALDISSNGDCFITGGEEKLLKVWDYDTGKLKNIGRGHSGAVSGARFSPNQSLIVSVGEDGGIFLWDAESIH